ncbi:MAG: hypothetical protein JNM25_11205 [Planctomycetes bacterium]|nr:hypothetical protein [Planctomycetota bacterium]
MSPRSLPWSFPLLLATTALAQAPGGYKTYENKQAELTFFYPTSFAEVPLPPTEQVLIAKFVLRQLPQELKKIDERILKALEPELLVFSFDVETPTTGAAEPEAPSSGPATVKEAMEASSRVTSWEQFAARFARWKLVPDTKKPDQIVLQWQEQPIGGETPIGYLVRKQEGSTIFGVYGFSLAPHEKRFQSQILKMAGSLAIADEERSTEAAARIERLYKDGKYRGVEARKKARGALARGWKALDTENYLIVHHSKSDALMKRIGREIEAMRAFYSELFPPAAPMDSVSVVRVCRTRDEYHQYGGPPNTGGYWHPGNEELVFYDYSYTQRTLSDDEKKAMGNRKLTNDDSLLVLYHEAFHQYIHYAIGEFSPHDWFNEGYGDYFSGAVLADTTSRVLRIDPSPWRIHLAKDQCEFGEGFVPLEKLLKAERSEFYNRARIGHYYAAAWSFVYFLKNSKEVAAHPVWSKLLDVYLAEVKAAYQTRIAAAGADADLGQKQVAGFEARHQAVAKMLEGVDLAELEAKWKQWVVDLRDPWPSQRKKRK